MNEQPIVVRRPPRSIDKPPAKPGRPSTALIVHRNPDGTRQPIRGLE